jgi:N-methylhydantoinase B
MNSGGGYGDPIKRPPALVLDDFHEGFVGAELARRIYGVVLNDGVIEEAGTVTRRQEIRRERLARAAQPRTLVRSQPDRDRSGVIHRFPVAEELKVVTIGEQSFIACADCGYLICDAASNYKLGSACINGSLVEIDDKLFSDPRDELDEDIVYREFLCPNCGILFENELTKASEEPLWDVEFTASALELKRHST